MAENVLDKDRYFARRNTLLREYFNGVEVRHRVGYEQFVTEMERVLAKNISPRLYENISAEEGVALLTTHVICRMHASENNSRVAEWEKDYPLRRLYVGGILPRYVVKDDEEDEGDDNEGNGLFDTEACVTENAKDGSRADNPEVENEEDRAFIADSDDGSDDDCFDYSAVNQIIDWAAENKEKKSHNNTKAGGGDGVLSFFGTGGGEWDAPSPEGVG